MIFDSLSIVSTIVVIFVLFLIFGTIYYSHITTKNNIKILARNSILMNADDEMRDLCKKIMRINPDACPLLDGDTSKLIKSDPDRLKALLKEHLRKLEGN